MFRLSKLKSLRLVPDWHPRWKALIGWGTLLGMILTLTAAFHCQVFPADTAKNPGVVRALPFTPSELEDITSRFMEPTSLGTAGLQPAISEDGIDVRQLASWGKDTGYAVAFAPGGKLLAVGSSVGIYLYDTRDLSETNLIVTGIRVRGLAFSPDGAILAGGLFDDSVRLWRVADGQLLRTLKGHTKWVRDVAISPDGAYLASASDDDTLRLWRLSDGALVRTIQVGTQGVRCVAFSPDGKVLASGDRIGAVHLWRVADGKLIQTLLGHTEWVRTVAFSPDGKLLASGSFDKTARIWQLANGELLHTLKEHTETVLSVAFSPDGAALATGSADKTIGLWRVADGASLGRLTGHEGFVFDVAFSPEGALLASGAEDNTIRMWNVSGEEKAQQAQGQASGPGEGTAFTTSDCRFCHHPKSATQPSFIVQVRCETCHPEGASLNWCPAIPRSSGIRGLPHNLAIEPSTRGTPGDRKDIGLIIATPGNGEVLYSPNDTHSVAFVKGIVFYDRDPSEIQVQLDLLSGSNRVATLSARPQQDGKFSFLLGLSPNGGLPVSQTNVANDILTCLSCHSTTVEAYLPPGQVRLVVSATTPQGSQAQDERWIVVERSGQATAPVKVLDEDKREPVPGLPVQATTVLYGWRGRQFSATTNSQGDAVLEIEALTEASTPYLMSVPPTVLDGVFYSSRRPAQLLLPPGAGSAISVTLAVRAQLGQIQGGLEPERGGALGSVPVWAVRSPDGAAHRTQATSTGHFTFSQLPIADYLVIPDPDATAAHGWIGEAQEAQLTTSPVMTMNLTLSKLEGRTLKGTVRDTSGSPLPFAWVEVDQKGFALPVNPDTGEWLLRGVSAGPHTLVVLAPGYYSQERNVAAIQETAQTLNVTLERRPETRIVAWGNGQIVIPPETKASVNNGIINVERGWMWGTVGAADILTLDVSGVEIKMQEGIFALENRPGKTAWFYLGKGKADIQSPTAGEPITVAGGEMVALLEGGHLSAVPLEPVAFRLLHPAEEAPLNPVWQPTVQDRIKSSLTQAGVATAQIFTLVTYVLIVLAFLSTLVFASLRWVKRSKAHTRSEEDSRDRKDR